MIASVPETVIVVAARGWAGGTAAALRTLVERLVRSGVETAMVAEAACAAAARTRRGPRERKQAFGRCANLPMPGTHRDVAGGARAQEAPTRPGLFVLPDSASETATQHNQP